QRATDPPSQRVADETAAHEIERPRGEMSACETPIVGIGIAARLRWRRVPLVVYALLGIACAFIAPALALSTSARCRLCSRSPTTGGTTDCGRPGTRRAATPTCAGRSMVPGCLRSVASTSIGSRSATVLTRAAALKPIAPRFERL